MANEGGTSAPFPPVKSATHGWPLLPVGLLASTFLKLGTRSVEVHGLPGLLELLKSRRRGVVTVSNHVSVLDEPLCWGVLPWRTYLHPRQIRWTLGASDIMYTNALFRRFFNDGQCIETYRGGAQGGIYQPAVDLAIQKLREGEWVHIFPEGKVNQDPLRNLLRFRWGVSRMLLEAGDEVEVVPMWIQGFEQVMDEERGFPRMLPRLGKNVAIVFGKPITDKIRPLVQAYRNLRDEVHDRPTPPDYHGEPAALREARVKIAELLRHEVQQLGRDFNAGKAQVVGGGVAQPQEGTRIEN